MECLAVRKLPEGQQWSYEVKWDGYRVQALRRAGTVTLLSKTGKDLTRKFPWIATGLTALPVDTLLDGELVALDENGKPSFQLLQRHRSEMRTIAYFPFDILFHRERDLRKTPLDDRREILRKAVKIEGLQLSEVFDTTAQNMIRVIRSYGLEGVIAKRRDSYYESGRRSGAWLKMRLNLGQEFVIGGYIPNEAGVVESLVVGFYNGNALQYAARVRAGLVVHTRRDLAPKLKGLHRKTCPFTNVPDTSLGRWGEGMTIAVMAKCVWVTPGQAGRASRA
jgi:DNA ligase D-like protein (predicted ligase)